MYGCCMAGGSGATGTTTSATSPASWVAETRWRLAAVDPGSLSDRERVELVAELERLKGAASATQARAVHALGESRAGVAPRDAVRSVGSEVALARRESPSRGDRFVRLSHALVMELPGTLAALSKGVIGEWHAIEVAQQSAMLTAQDRAELDRRLGPVLGRLSPQAAGRAARRVAAELDAAAVTRRMERAAGSRRVSVRAAGDGMAYLTVLAPGHEAVGAYSALKDYASSVVSGQRPQDPPDGRRTGAVMADTATRLLSGRAAGQVQPVELHLVMTDRSLLGMGDRNRSVSEPARVPGHGSVPAPVAQAWVRDAAEASVWLRRVFTTPDGRDLVAMDSRRRIFPRLLRRMLVLRDDVCTTPWCDAPIAHADHTQPVRDGGPTDWRNGSGKCARCNHVKEAPGWRSTVIGGEGSPCRDRAGSPPREVRLTTPLGRTYRSQPPPLLGWGSPMSDFRSEKRACRRQRVRHHPPTPRRPLLRSRLERELCRLMT